MNNLIKFGTFNILNTNYVHFNNGFCTKTNTVSDEDEIFRNSILIKLIENNEFDILFLQEVSHSFFDLLDKSILKEKFNLNKNNELLILTNKKIITEPINTNIYLDNDKDKNFISKRILAISCNLNGNNFLMINVHLPSNALYDKKVKVTKLVHNIIMKETSDNLNDLNIIIAGDMNTEKYVFSNLYKQFDIKSIINESIKSKFSTSFKMGKCEDGIFKLSDKNKRHFFIDDIYLSNNLSGSNINFISLYDSNYKFIDKPQTGNQLFKFENQGTPYCNQKTYADNGFCEINKTPNKYSYTFNNSDVKPWPSDHLLLYATFNIENIGTIENIGNIGNIRNIINILNNINNILNIKKM